MREKMTKEENVKCYVCGAYFRYKVSDAFIYKTWLPWWLGGTKYRYVKCPGCGEHLVVEGMI
jgi:DNA-directed RNA polymerase subunit RPC12/RpoP